MLEYAKYFLNVVGILGTLKVALIFFVTEYTHCLKITQNVAFENLNFGIFHQFLSY